MILIVSHKQDFTADFLINRLNELKIAYLRLNCEDLLKNPAYFINDESNFQFNLLTPEKISSVWFRRTQVPDVPGLSVEEKLYFYREFEMLLDNVYHSMEDCKWLSNPFKIRLAESKMYQLKKAKALGFNIPKTIVTNSKARLREFYGSNLKTIIKPLYSGYVPSQEGTSLFYTSIISQQQMQELEEFDLTPCIYQEYIEKEFEIRLTVVDDQVFAAKVDSQKNEEAKVDWRKSRLHFDSFDIPEEIGAKGIALCRALGISFGAIDLIKTKTGEYVFLEINPNGQWAWIEMETGLKISDAIIHFLIQPND